jgi:hypothetical protein
MAEYYLSKYYDTGDAIDERLLKGVYDDAVTAGYDGTKEDFDKYLATAASSFQLGGSVYMGFATPDTEPKIPVNNGGVFYLATEAGTYKFADTNSKKLVVSDHGIYIIYHASGDGNYWTAINLHEGISNYITGLITTEANAREEADKAEAEERKYYDDLLEEHINTKTSELKKEIDTVNESLYKAIESEATTREANDNTLGDKILELQNEVFPVMSTFTVNPLIIPVGVDTTITFNYKVIRKNLDVTEKAIKTINGNQVTGNTSSEVVNLEHGASKTYSFISSYEDVQSDTISRTIKATKPSYFGVVPADWSTSDGFSTLTSSLIGDKSLQKSNINIENGKIVYAYPADFNELTSVKDGNGYEVLSSYELIKVQLNDISYNCYLLANAVTAIGVTQIYK